MFFSLNYNGKVYNSRHLTHFPEQPWLIPFLVQAGIIATHLGLSLHDLIKKQFVRRQQHTSIEMSRGDGHAGKWKTDIFQFSQLRFVVIANVELLQMMIKMVQG